MAPMPGGGSRSTLRVGRAVLAFVLGIVVSAPAQDAAQDAEAVNALVHEAVEQIHRNAYRTEPRAVICTKALHALIAQLGESAKKHDRDLATLQDDAAEAELVRILQTIAATPGQRFGLRELA